MVSLGPGVGFAILTLGFLAATSALHLGRAAFEPLMAGGKLAMSPMLMLSAVFFWSIIWQMPGAFIGVQIMMVVLSICAHTSSSRRIAELLSGDGS